MITVVMRDMKNHQEKQTKTMYKIVTWAVEVMQRQIAMWNKNFHMEEQEDKDQDTEEERIHKNEEPIHLLIMSSI